MDVIKKNMWSIICGVVALLAVAATYWPLGGRFEELNGKLAQSVSEYQRIRGQNNLNPNLPVIDPKTSEPRKLGQFPTEKVIARGKEVVTKIHSESEKLSAKAMEMNKREQLALGALPAGTRRSDFKDEYYRRLEEMRKELDATTTPTPEEIKAKEAQMLKDDFLPMIKKRGDQEINRAEIDHLFEEARAALPAEMKLERAQTHTMYIMPDRQGTVGLTTSFDYHPGIPLPETDKLPTVIDVWAAQLGFWIQEDVVRAIVETNGMAAPKGTKVTVENSIVKRLSRTDIPKQYITKTGPVDILAANSPVNMIPQGGAAATVDDPNAPAPKTFGYSATGRVCNSVYDVMHFTVAVDADAQRFGTFMTNLTRGKFITILKADVVGLDRERMQQVSSYYYGKQPVVRLTLKCEAIFFRNWTLDPQKPLMPVNVQKLLRVPQTPGSVALN